MSVSHKNIIIPLLVTNKLNNSNTVFRLKKLPNAKGKHCRLAITELIGTGNKPNYTHNVSGKSQLTFRQDKSGFIFFMAMCLIIIYLVVLV